MRSAAAAWKLMWATDILLRRDRWERPERTLVKEVRDSMPGVSGGCGACGRSTSSGWRKARPRASGSTIWMGGRW